MKEEERRGEMREEVRKTRKAGRLKQREKECIAIATGLCPTGRGVLFFFFKSLAPGDLMPGQSC